MSALVPVDYDHDGVRLVGQLATPAGTPRGAVLVMHDGMGQGDVVRDRAQRLADAGYIAFTSDMFGDGIRCATVADASPRMRGLMATPGALRARILRGLETLNAQPGAADCKKAAIGFCFGGMCVLELARTGADVALVVSYHGLLTTTQPAQPGAIKSRVVVFTGGQDPLAPAEHVSALREEMAAAGATLDLTVFGDGYHAFTDPTAAERTELPGLKYDPLLDRTSWAATLALLEDLLAPSGASTRH